MPLNCITPYYNDGRVPLVVREGGTADAWRADDGLLVGGGVGVAGLGFGSSNDAIAHSGRMV